MNFVGEIQAMEWNEAAVEKLLAAHDGDMALLYLYLVKEGEYDTEAAAAALLRTRREIEDAKEKLDRLLDAPAESGKSVPEKKKKPLIPGPDELPEYTNEEVARRTGNNEEFAAILSECEQVMGHGLSAEELKTLFGIYDYLRLPTEVIFMLLHFCADFCRERYGEQRRPTARLIEREAYRWVNQEILTIDQAEEYIRRQSERRSLVAALKKDFAIYERPLTASEQKYFLSWLEMGFGEEEIMLAYDRMMVNTGNLSWSYIDRILSIWNEKKLYTAKEIEEKDPPRRAGTKKPRPQSTQTVVDLNELDNLFKE